MEARSRDNGAHSGVAGAYALIAGFTNLPWTPTGTSANVS